MPSRIDFGNESANSCAERLYPEGIPSFVNYHFDAIKDTAQTIAQLRFTMSVDGKSQELKILDLPLQR